MKDYFTLTFLRTRLVLALLAGVVALIVDTFVGDFLKETFGLPPRAIGIFAALIVVGAAVALLWRAALRDWARRPDGSDSREDSKQRS